MASTNSGWPPLSVMYTHTSSRMVSRSSLGMLMSDMNSSSTSEDWRRDSSVTSGGPPDDCPAVAIGAVLVGVEDGLVGGGVAVDDWGVEGAGWSGVDWTEVEVGVVCAEVDVESLAGVEGLPSR